MFLTFEKNGLRSSQTLTEYPDDAIIMPKKDNQAKNQIRANSINKAFSCYAHFEDV